MHSLSTSIAALVSLLAFTAALPTPPSTRSWTPSVSTAANTVPLNGLPALSNLTLKYIALGLGTQNYTCTDTSSTPTSIGALATLYDATFLSSSVAAADILDLPETAYELDSSLGLPLLGHHYFAAAGRPTFDLSAARPSLFLSAAKSAEIAAPSTSVAGSVDWLYLVDSKDGDSVGLKAVYRVETAGGKASATCVQAGDLDVRYAAEYWYVEPT